MFCSTKTFGHDLGLSVAFRQWRATHSHCRFLHGYALAVSLVFEADELDARGWVVDFGALKEVREWLRHMFDHKTLIARDDPLADHFRALAADGGCDLVVVERVGCEAFADLIFSRVVEWMKDEGLAPRVRLRSVEVREHGANSAILEAPVLWERVP